jgi:hypothetical protein
VISLAWARAVADSATAASAMRIEFMSNLLVQ